jgi:RNA polymerase sigma-70 factor (TIGR02960 family)
MTLTQHQAIPTPEADDVDRLAAAQRGDEAAFDELTRPFRRELHVHCYRMLGSLDDADDALQETLLRAWRGLDQFQPRAPIRAWLYRIATNVCLTHLHRKTRRGEAVSLDLAGGATSGSGEEDEPVQLQPYPDHLLDELRSVTPGPAATVEGREGVELAFVAAAQMLPPRQRASLLLRDVVGYNAAEVAAMLETSVAAVNSALQRARATLAQERDTGLLTRSHTSPGSAVEQALVRRLVDAWHAADVPAIVAILTEDALFTMPPQPNRYVGREAIGAFLATGPAQGRLDRFRLVPTRANRQPAVAAYYRDQDSGPFLAHGVIVLAFDGNAIASLVRFGDASLFQHFGLPTSIDGETNAQQS